MTKGALVEKVSSKVEEFLPDEWEYGVQKTDYDNAIKVGLIHKETFKRFHHKLWVVKDPTPEVEEFILMQFAEFTCYITGGKDATKEDKEVQKTST